MEVNTIAAFVVVFCILVLWMRIKALEQQVSYLNHLYGDLVHERAKPDCLEGDEWKHGKQDEE